MVEPTAVEEEARVRDLIDEVAGLVEVRFDV